MSDRRNYRSGYTAIELMLVLSIIAVLSAMTAPSVVSSLRSAAASGGAEMIETVAREARILAMSNNARSEHYGVVVYAADGRHYAALTYGAAPTVANIMQASDGEPILQMVLNRNVAVFLGADHADHEEDVIMVDGDEFGWMHQYRTGHAVNVAGAGADSISIGTPDSPVVDEISVRTLDQNVGFRCAVYPLGLTGVEELEL